ncbi:MAG: DUF2520 domain-containing protein [Actinobacteria bacterium]|nr:DUF2520 domain-containing protein [Actinomycetota bacterium]MCL6095757.1 DUF2520 domain-containing protein [Actinomycetota bacterium]
MAATVRLVGAGRAGSSLAAALSQVGWEVEPILRRGDDLRKAADGVDVVFIATDDLSIPTVAAEIEPVPSTVVAHLSGALGLDVLLPHLRRASMHPLVPLPDPTTGAARLLSGAPFAVSGDEFIALVVNSLGGRIVEVAEDHRVLYHAAACIAANHLVALLGQVERVAKLAGLQLEDFLDLSRMAIEDVARLGPAAALTGPAARKDWATINKHREALPPSELLSYNALVDLAVALSTAHEGEAR